MRTRLLNPTAIATFIVATTSLCIGASIRDDFNDGNDNGWAHYEPLAPFGAPASFSFPGGAYRIQASASPDPSGFGFGRAGSMRLDQGFVNFAIDFDLLSWNNGLNQSFGILGRASNIGFGTTDGYAFTYSTAGSIGIWLVVNDRMTALASASISLDPATHYHFSFGAAGRVLSGDVVDDLHRPVGFVQSLDTTYSSGATGFYLFSNTNDGTVDATFDNYFAGEVPEPSIWSLLVLGGTGLACSAVRKRRSRPAERNQQTHIDPHLNSNS